MIEKRAKTLEAAEIRELREKLELNQADFALKLGCSVNSIYLWEKGKYSPRGANAELLINLAMEHGVIEKPITAKAQSKLEELTEQPGEDELDANGDETEANNALAGILIRVAKGIEENNRYMIQVLNRFDEIDKLKKQMEILKYELEQRNNGK